MHNFEKVLFTKVKKNFEFHRKSVKNGRFHTFYFPYSFQNGLYIFVGLKCILSDKKFNVVGLKISD
jgi:hypothetical protein